MLLRSDGRQLRFVRGRSGWTADGGRVQAAKVENDATAGRVWKYVTIASVTASVCGRKGPGQEGHPQNAG